MLVDSHCHLNFPDFADDMSAVLASAAQADIGVMQTICTKQSEFDDVYALTRHHKQLYCSVGVHPHEADTEALVARDWLADKAALPRVIGLGETGLDYYYDHSDRAVQRESFMRHIDVARETGLPVIIHTREAEDDTITMMSRAMRDGSFKALIHCFTGTQRLADAMLELGCYISLSGIITFNNAADLRETVSTLPLNRLLVETDSPYLAPMPHRGKRNEPAYTRYVCEKLAELLNITATECAAATTDNFFTLFSKASKPALTSN